MKKYLSNETNPTFQCLNLINELINVFIQVYGMGELI